MEKSAQLPTDLPPILSADDFRRLVYKDVKADNSGTPVCRDFDGDRLVVKATTKTDEFEFVASTESVDRDRDTIRAKGFDLKAYRKAPVWLAFHDPRQWIGVSVHVEVEDDKFFNTLKLGPGPMARFVKEMIEFRLETKALKDAGASCSVGYLPLKFERAPEDSGRRFGIDFIKQELLETSHVPIGSNRDALLRAKAAGIDHGVVGDWAASYRRQDSGLLTVNIKTAEAIIKALDPSRGIALFEMSPAEIGKISTPAEPPPEADDDTGTRESSAEKRHEELVGSVASLVAAMTQKHPGDDGDAPLPDADEPPQKAYEKLAEDHISERVEDEIIRRTGAIPSS